MHYNKDTLTNALENIEERLYDHFYKHREITNRVVIELVCLQLRSCNTFLKRLFNKRVKSTLHCEFSIYANSLEERQEVLDMVFAMGYSNVETVRATVLNAKLEEYPDPNTKYEIIVSPLRAERTTSMGHFLAGMFDSSIAEFKENAINHYHTDRHCQITLNDKALALRLLDKINNKLKVATMPNDKADKPTAHILTQNIDAWTVILSYPVILS